MAEWAAAETWTRSDSLVDALAVKYGVEKIKTIGDAYMARAGLPQPMPDHAIRLARMVLDMLREKAVVADQARAQASSINFPRPVKRITRAVLRQCFNSSQ
jgi:class 3 adenylate cyclase